MDQHTHSVLYKREISIWKRDEYTGKIYLAGSFNTMEEFFQTFAGAPYYYYHKINFAGFSSNFDERQEYGYAPFDHKRYFDLCGSQADRNRWLDSFYSYVCYDCFDKHYSRDRLVGLYRSWREDRRKLRRIRGWLQHGWRRGAYGGYKLPRSTQEMRWAEAWDDEEFAPKNGFARPRRRGHTLPNAWDDCISHSDKSWKTQSKRKHQWKTKK